MSGFASLAPLLAPRSVAVVGASADPTRIGGRPIAYMQARGFAGPVYPVNPNRSEIQGLAAFADIASLPEAPDVAIVAVPASQVTATIAALGARGAKAAIVFSAGFAETGESGAALQAEMVAVARAHGIRVLGPNSLGLFNDRCRLLRHLLRLAGDGLSTARAHRHRQPVGRIRHPRLHHRPPAPRRHARLRRDRERGRCHGR